MRQLHKMSDAYIGQHARPVVCHQLFSLWTDTAGCPRPHRAKFFHASLSLTNLASIRTNHIYHHVYEFGTISVFSHGQPAGCPCGEQEVVLKRCLPGGGDG